MHPQTRGTAPKAADSGAAKIPDYAHPVPVSVDGITFRRGHGPRTKESAERLSQYRAEAARIMAARIEGSVFTRADYMAVTP